MENELILLVGPIGSGKTTFANTLATDSSIRISQDDMGKEQHLLEFYSALEDGVPRIIVDRMNFNREQRARYIEPARKAGYVITIFEFKTNIDECIERVVARKNHPTIKDGDYKLAIDIMRRYNKEYQPVVPTECDNYNEV